LPRYDKINIRGEHKKEDGIFANLDSKTLSCIGVNNHGLAKYSGEFI